MARGRWFTAMAMLVAAVLVAIAAAPSGAATPRPRLCLLGCTTTPTPTTTVVAPPVGQAPVAGAVTVSAVTPTTAHLSAPLNTGGEADTYGWSFDGPPSGVSVSGIFNATADPDPTTVTYAYDHLTPNSTYHARLNADDTAGDSAGPTVTFKTPILPALGITLTVPHPEIVEGDGLSVSAAVPRAGAVDIGDLVGIQLRLSNGRWARQDAFGETELNAFHRLAAKIDPNRNTRVRAELVGTNPGNDADGRTRIRRRSYSRSIPVIVEPRIEGGVARPNDGPDLQIYYEALVHGLPRGYRGESVYFYLGAPHSTQVRLLGSRQLRYEVRTGQPQLDASYTFREISAVELVTCVRHQLLSDMGLPFTDAGCGRATLTLH